MKKAMLGFIASAMSLLATTAQAGDIRSIDPCDQYGYVIENGSMAQPYTAGQTAYFRIRLENMNSRESWETKDTTKLSNPWRFQYTGVGLDSALEWAINPPKVGVYVSGQLRGATVISALPPADKGWYTDVLCSYTVRPGDLALPMTLANQAGKEMGDGSASEYYLDTIPRSGAWRLMSYERESASTWDTVVATNTCTFKYGETKFFNVNASAASEMTEWTTDYALKQAGLYLKSVDFTAAEYSVAHGRTEKVNVGIVGGVNTNGNGTVYAMVKDGDAVALAEDSVEVVTVAEDPNGDTDVAYQVAKVTIPSGTDVDSFSFKVKGVTQGGESTVYLSTTKSFTYGDSKDLVTNFVTAVVKCVEPPPPYISVTLDGAASKSVTSNANYTDYAAKLTVTLSEAHTSDVTVDVTPAMVSNNGTDPLGKYIGMSTYSENGFLEKVSTVAFTAAEMAAGTLSKDLYVYVLGADDQTDGVGKGILFKPANVAIYNNENVSAILYIKKSTPQIQYPAEGQSYSGLAGGVASAFTIKISDDYTNMQSPFTVEWLKTGSGTPQTISGVNVNSDGEATVSIRYNAGEYTTRFRVKNAAGVWSDYRTISVQVNPAKQVSAVVEDPNDSGEYDETDEELTVRFNLTEAYEDSTLYAFLVPMDAASSNLVVCKAFDTGVAIRSGDTNSTGTAKIQLLDGTEETLPLTYSIVLRTEKTWDKGETIGTYESKDLEVYINNVAPTVLAVNMSGSAPVTVNGGKFGGKASMGLNKIFTLEADDVDADLEASVTSEWTFSDPNGNAVTKTVVGPLYDIALTNVFEVAGVFTCTVKLQDKDMGKKKWGEAFSFQVEVLNTPSLSIVFPNSNTFGETEADKGTSYFYVDLSTPATKQIDVEIECTQVGANGVMEIATKSVSYRPGQVRQQVLISEMDGTANSVSFKGGFSVTARVVTETLNEDGIALKDVYLPVTEKMYVANEVPTIVLPFNTGVTNDAAINVQIPIKWKIDDVDADLTNNLTVVWTTSEGIRQEFVGDDISEGVFTNIFKTGGAKTVTMTVTDKDDGPNSVTLYYYVSPSKLVTVLPFGPYMSGANTEVSKKYASAFGIGEGRVEGENSPLIQYFAHKYSYGFSDTVAAIKAWGYKNGEIDNAINEDGNSRNADEAPYAYSDVRGRDSFFYAWVIGSKEDDAATYTGVPVISPLPPAAGGRFASYNLALPTEQAGDDARPVFADRLLEVFFSKELYPADNMGDMNADGIPDYYAVLGWSMDTGESKSIAEAMTGVKISSGGEEGEGEGATASDLTDVSTYNGDGDFFPLAWTSANPLNPSIKNWGPGLPFTAYDEIRGVGIGLNHPGVSEFELTDAERFALLADFVAAGNAVSGTDEENYAAATNWAARTGWSPEAVDPNTGSRLNPLKADTDGDGFDDGWEYFFWYHAKVGAVVDGKWSRLEGRRFSPESPDGFVRISPEEIVQAFNPLVKRNVTGLFGSDFDNDGLTDFEEYILGTNPVCFDVNSDGVLELYKVMNGIDPNSEFYNDGNPDCDFMARCDYEEDTFTVYTFENGEMYALPSMTSSSPVLESLGETSEVYKVEFASGEIAWLKQLPAVASVAGAKFLASDVAGFTSLSYEGTEHLGSEKVYCAGMEVKSVAEETVPMQNVAITGFNWIDPDTLESATTVKALPLFNYGFDGTTYVPCVTNVFTYALAPTDSALVKIEQDKIVTLIHNQVFCQYGFDPRTAWNSDDYGYVDQRWRKEDSTEADGLNEAGLAVNTVPYTTRDEFFVMQYRQQLRAIGEDGKRSATKSMLNDGDRYLLLNTDAEMLVAGVSYLQMATTYPNLPVSFVRAWYASRQEVSPFDNSTNKTVVAYWTYLENDYDVHGADTDYDGVPDGWELYVNADPNNTDDGKIRDGWAKDDDNLCILEEYAGVDSCNAYTNRFSLTDPSKLIYPEATTITKHHPGKDKGWWNKFFPTNPFSKDTDGDGIMDDAEGKGATTDFSVGTTWYGSQPFTFIYGDDETTEKYAADGSSTCFRGGGLNPCTVDTDGDILPDAWEFQFAGILFKDGKTDVKLSTQDLAILKAADGKQSALTNATTCIRGGMDGTFKGDSDYDFDHDGLANCQEYLVQALRHLRYDDSLTPLMGLDPTTKEFVGFIPFSAWDGEAFHARCLQAGFTGLGAWQFRELGYFVLPPHEWDMLRQNNKGITDCANYEDYEGAGYRVMLPPVAYLADGSIYKLYVNGAMQYASTDPRRVDTDYDGMDDYWELFHGLNPILGSYANPFDSGEYGWLNSQYDKIAEIHGGEVTSWYNHWTGWDFTKQPAVDPIRYPWMMGVMEADADGDGLRNDEEALKVNLANPRNTHTDPTPLWMTDSSGKASYTSQYYNPDPYITGYTGSTLDVYPDLLMYPWSDMTVKVRLAAEGMGGTSLNWMFAFEENEGYDTDHDFRRDSTELTHGVEMSSDPLKHTDLDRRQALYFMGERSAAVSYGGEFRRSPSTEPDLLKQFTVECWVKADGEQSGDVTILERVCDYGASTLVNGSNVIRANFRIGMDVGGHIYGEFEGTTANSASVRVTDKNVIEAGKWTHVAFRFDGENAHLHIDGEIAPVASVTGAGLQPANGIDGIQQTPDQSVIPLTGYRALPCATVLGASIVADGGFAVDEETTWSDYGRFFKGWIDEVRIWDGARSAVEINDSYKRAFTMDDIKQMRSNAEETGVFERWRDGARRSAVNGNVLPAELLQHYSFSTLPGGVEPGNVITEPTGFRASVLNNVRKPNGSSLDLHTMVGRWYNTPVHSEVYSDYHVVPWIPNTVAHLPFLDGSAPDSQFWATGIAGVNLASSMGIEGYEFPNSANPYPYYFYRRDRYNRLKLLSAVEDLGSNTVSTTSMYAKWRFDLRSGFVGTSDLIPLGRAFAKRDSDYWDGQGSMDAWTDTRGSVLESADSDGDGIPDWAENLGIVDRDAYLRALADGLLPNGKTDSRYESTVDADFDGVKDWWQKFYDLADSAKEDTDKDGLADFAEYLITEKFFTNIVISPQIPKSNGREFDYFLKAGKLYLGEMFSDHDFMEDHLEREYSEIGASAVYYDPHLDDDDDGWSNWAEIRAKYDMGIGWNATGNVQTNTILNNYTDYSDYKSVMAKIESDPSKFKLLDTSFTITGYSSYSDSYYGQGYIKYQMFTPVYAETYIYEGTPVPEVEMTVHYNGVVDLINAKLAVTAYSGDDLSRPDATFYVQNGDGRNVNTLKFQYPDYGYLREGKNTFVVSVASTNAMDASYSMMGVVRNVDVGWKKVKFEVELAETTPICQRTTIPAGSTNDMGKVYVYRYSIDNVVTPPSSLDYGPVVVKDLGNRTSMHEGDFMSAADFDLDWSGFESKVLNNSTVRAAELPVNKVVYRVYRKEVDLEREVEKTNTNKMPFVEIVREFGGSRATAVPVSPGEDHTIYYGGQPTFRWKVEGDRPDTYTAFAIQVKDGSSEIWNSGTQMLPPKNSKGEYVWTAPLYVGDQVGNGRVFGSQNNYSWSVTMYNSKYQDDFWSASRDFRVNVYDADEPSSSEYHTLDAVVKYFGPGKFNASVDSTTQKIRVEAFTTPDFSGMPAGRTFVSDVDSVVDSNHDVNVRIVGLPAGEYYLRAYLDSDGDFKRSAWESWGYACPRGDKDSGAIYAPISVNVGNSANAAVAVVYVEDTDLDQDALPDVWEYDEAGGAEDFLLKKGPAENTDDGYIAINPDLVMNIARVAAANSAGGMLSFAASGYMPSAMASMMLGVDSVEPEIEEGTLGITAFSLDGDTVKLTVGAKADDPLAGSVFVSNGKITATVVVLHATSLAEGFAELKSVDVTFDIEEGAVSHTERISLKDILGDDVDLSKGFFKVELK